MRLNAKRWLLGAAGLGAAVAVLTLMGALYLAMYKETGRLFVGTPPYIETARKLAEGGPTSELSTLLQKFPHPPGWKATIITALPSDGTGNVDTQPILVADPPDLAGQTAGPGIKTVQGWTQWFQVASGPPISGPNGKTYTVSVIHTPDVRFLLNGLTVAGSALAWLALALWLFADARVRSRSAPGWLLLGLLTGPLGTAVWLITRPEPTPDRSLAQATVAPGTVCPGCGSDLVPQAAFCVRCGYALHPSCPECRRPVELEWSYCGTCGAPLND